MAGLCIRCGLGPGGARGVGKTRLGLRVLKHFAAGTQELAAVLAIVDRQLRERRTPTIR